MQERLDNFWKEYIAIGKEVLQAGKEIGYGASLIEVKFQDSEPSVVIRSISQNTRYSTNEEALEAVASLMAGAINTKLNGAMTFTVVGNGKTIHRILLDEYANRLLK